MKVIWAKKVEIVQLSLWILRMELDSFDNYRVIVYNDFRWKINQARSMSTVTSIKDVAEAAGVSTATVSRVLADKPHVRNRCG